MTLDAPSASNAADVPVRTVDTAATVPVREPALVGSGGTPTHIADGGHVGGSGSTPGGSGITPGGGGALPDAPTGGGGDSIAGGHGTDGPTGGSDRGPGNEWDPSQGDPVLSDADYGPGFTRPDPDQIRGNHIDPNYGQPRADHGRLGDQYLPPRIEDIPQHIWKLAPDPQALFGRDAAGHPLSREEFEARYINEENRVRYPGNDGAVVGHRLDFSSVEEFRAHYGDVLDRLGDERGRFMSLPETSFEARALPPGSLNDPLLTVRLTGELPPKMMIEVSEVVPALGREGGGLQVRIIDLEGQAMSINELRAQGIIEIIDDTRWPADWPRPFGGTTPHYSDWSGGFSE